MIRTDGYGLACLACGCPHCQDVLWERARTALPGKHSTWNWPPAVKVMRKRKERAYYVPVRGNM